MNIEDAAIYAEELNYQAARELRELHPLLAVRRDDNGEFKVYVRKTADDPYIGERVIKAYYLISEDGKGLDLGIDVYEDPEGGNAFQVSVPSSKYVVRASKEEFQPEKLEGAEVDLPGLFASLREGVEIMERYASLPRAVRNAVWSNKVDDKLQGRGMLQERLGTAGLGGTFGDAGPTAELQFMFIKLTLPKIEV